MSRRDSRIHAMMIIYQKELETFAGNQDESDGLKIEDEIFANSLIEKLNDKKEEIIDKINDSLKGWNYSRLGYLEKSILLLGYLEMMEFEEIPLNVSLDEWVDIAKEYCGEEAKKLVNGVLNDFKNILIREGIRLA